MPRMVIKGLIQRKHHRSSTQELQVHSQAILAMPALVTVVQLKSHLHNSKLHTIHTIRVQETTTKHYRPKEERTYHPWHREAMASKTTMAITDDLVPWCNIISNSGDTPEAMMPCLMAQVATIKSHPNTTRTFIKWVITVVTIFSRGTRSSNTLTFLLKHMAALATHRVAKSHRFIVGTCNRKVRKNYLKTPSGMSLWISRG